MSIFNLSPSTNIILSTLCTALMILYQFSQLRSDGKQSIYCTIVNIVYTVYIIYTIQYLEVNSDLYRLREKN